MCRSVCILLKPCGCPSMCVHVCALSDGSHQSALRRTLPDLATYRCYPHFSVDVSPPCAYLLEFPFLRQPSSSAAPGAARKGTAMGGRSTFRWSSRAGLGRGSATKAAQSSSCFPQPVHSAPNLCLFMGTAALGLWETTHLALSSH